jgi:hypothetical protein
MNDSRYPPKYGCQEYRAEMVLLSLRLRLQNEKTPPEEREKIMQEIARLEKLMGL